MAGIYLHIPFCKQACVYCDFHFSTNLASKPLLVRALIEELHQRNNYLADKKINSIYFGGGTPSLLSGAELETVFNAIGTYFSFDENIEITLEANPDDINPESINLWKTSGINRLSIGLQSFNDEELKWMNRAHTAAESLGSVKLAMDKGFENVTIDLIYGSRFQDLSTWEQTLKIATGLNTPHISAYNLTIENKTALGNKHSKGQEPGVNDELSSKQFVMMSNYLQQKGYEHYEISNFAKPGHRAVHNSNYWLGHPYLGLGPSAHSYNGASRQWNVKSNVAYIESVTSEKKYFELELLDIKDMYNEYVLTRLRTIWGCNLDEIKLKFGDNFANHFINIINRKAGFIKQEKEGNYVLTELGRLHADGIAADLFYS